jgi:hypothetical protein
MKNLAPKATFALNAYLARGFFRSLLPYAAPMMRVSPAEASQLLGLR